MRADAARNRDRILDEAQRLIARDGADVSMDEIAAAAGVAVGTLYRHHPTKAALVKAIVDRSVATIASDAEAACDRVRTGARAGDELATLFRAIARRQAADAAVKQAASVLGTRHDAASAARAPRTSPERRAWEAIASLLREAQRAGDVRRDVTMPDLVALLGGVPDAEAPASVRDRYVDVVLAGLRAAPAPRTPTRRRSDGAPPASA